MSEPAANHSRSPLLFMFVEFFDSKQFLLVPFLTWALASKVCKYVVRRWVKIFFFVAEQFYFIVTATFFISNELPSLRISQKVKALFFHKTSTSQLLRNKTIISDLLLFTISIFSFPLGQHYLAQNQMDYPERSVWSGYC